MTTDLHAAARRILERMFHEHPDVASEIAALVLTELLAACLFGEDETAVADFVLAINGKLHEIALARDAPSSFQLIHASRCGVRRPGRTTFLGGVT